MFYDKYLVFDQNFKGFLPGNNFLSGNFENMLDQIFYNRNKILEKKCRNNSEADFVKEAPYKLFFFILHCKTCSFKYVSKTLSDVKMISVDLK